MPDKNRSFYLSVFLGMLFFLSICLIIPTSLMAEGVDEEDVFIAPRLSENAIPWDERHPEMLDADMLYAQSAIVIEANTGDVIFEKNADAIMYPASTTKILTAYIALQMGDLQYDEVEVSQNAVDLVPSTYTRIPVSAGEIVGLYDLVAATLVRSGMLYVFRDTMEAKSEFCMAARAIMAMSRTVV